MSDLDGLLDSLLMVKARAPNLRLGQLVILLQLARTEGLRVGDLARLCGESQATTSRYIARMTDAAYAGSLGDRYGFVELQRGEFDSRVRHVVLTEMGIELVNLLNKPTAKQPGLQ